MKSRYEQGRNYIKKNIDRHVDVIKLRLSDKEIDDITVSYWAKVLKGKNAKIRNRPTK